MQKKSKGTPGDRVWNGKWIWDVPQPEEMGRTEHKLVYFRRSFQVPDGIRPRLIVHITADSRYRLFVNGTPVAVGPCKGDAHVQYYETVDVTPYLKVGENVLAVQVLHYPYLQPYISGVGGPISVWRSQSAGLFVEAALCDGNGNEVEPLHSGREWKVYRHRGYRHIPEPLFHWMGGVEEVDGKGTPHGWQLPGFDDADWCQAVPFEETRHDFGLLSPWNLQPRPIPFLYEEVRTFVRVIKTEGIDLRQAKQFLERDSEGGTLQLAPGQKVAIEFDAGELTTAYLMTGVRKGRGSIVRLLCSECYEPQESTVNRRIKENREDPGGKLMGAYDVYHVAGVAGDQGMEVYEPFWFRTFRFVRLEIEAGSEPVELVTVKFRETGYPLDVKGRFRCSDDELNTIWGLSVRTLKRCMHETYEDCPYYEQLQYAMDSRLMMLFTYYVSADDRLPRRTIDDFYRSRLPGGLLQSRFPSVEPQIIPSFALYWVDMLAEHYAFNGDLELILRYRPALLELLDWFHGQLNEEGIVGVTSNRYWTYFDWVEAWPKGAPPESQDRPMFLLSLMYAKALRTAAGLLEATGWKDAAGEMRARADAVCCAVRRLAWSPERMLFRDLPDTEIYSQHTQIMAVLSDAIEGEQARNLMERALREPIHRVTLPFSYLLFQALKKTGLHQHIFRQWDRWRVFLRQGLTTLPETEVNPRSDCHAWSSVPLAEFPAYFLGVTPARPGFSAISIEPRTGLLRWAKGTVPTVRGLVEVEWEKTGRDFKFRTNVPEGVPAIIKLPDGSEHQLQNGGLFETTVSCA